MFNDFFLIFYWWFLLLGLGIIFIPLTFFLFQRFFDRGYAFSKIVAILIVTYAVWLGGSLRVLPFLKETVWLVVIFAAISNFFLLSRRRQWLKAKLKKIWPVIFWEEMFFFICLTLWSFVRGFQPNIQGLEKFMDYGFVNSILRSQYFPPADIWLAGKTINYYYFGHFITAFLTKLSGIDSAITYNLMIATLFALSFTASFSLGANFISLGPRKKKGLIIGGGLLTAALLTLGGNLQPLWWFLKNGNFANYWYPDATRFIIEKFGAFDNTIHEFPIYSFVVADLHGHLLDLPVVLLFLGLILHLTGQKKLGFLDFLLPSLILGIMYMTNAWDLPIYLLIFGVVVLLRQKTFLKTFLFVACCVLLAILFSLPFHLHFRSITNGIGLVDFRSPIWMPLVLWGFPLVMTLSLALFLATRKLKPNIFVLILLGTAWFLILVPELFYIKDIYIHSYQRANTMFKLTYQSFVMFSLANGYIIIRILIHFKQKLLKFISVVFLLPFLSFIFIYPYFAVRSYYGLNNYQGIDGLNYLKNLYPDDYRAILWLRQNITNQPVIVEAVGESYTDFARVSANTGLPTILGWRVHEWLWRGSFDEPAKRTEEVKTVYESNDLEKTKQVLEKYQVKFIFLGSLERQQYPALNETKFGKLGKVVFLSGTTKIYQISSF